MKKRFAKVLPCGFTPERLMHHSGEPTVAITLSGIAFASALITIIGRKCPISARAPPAAGCLEFNIEPSGAVIVIGRKTPSLFGTSGESTAFTPYAVYAMVYARQTLIERSTWGAEPA